MKRRLRIINYWMTGLLLGGRRRYLHSMFFAPLGMEVNIANEFVDRNSIQQIWILYIIVANTDESMQPSTYLA